MFYLIEELWQDGIKFRVGVAQDYLKAKDRFQAQVDKLKVIHGFNAVSHVHSESSRILARRHETVVVSLRMVNAEPGEYLEQLEERQAELQHERLAHGWCEACEKAKSCPGMNELSHKLQDIEELLPMLARIAMLPAR